MPALCDSQGVDLVRATLVEFLDRQLGTSDLAQAATYLERPLRLTAHLIMSSPQFQLC